MANKKLFLFLVCFFFIGAINEAAAGTLPSNPTTITTAQCTSQGGFCRFRLTPWTDGCSTTADRFVGFCDSNTNGCCVPTQTIATPAQCTAGGGQCSTADANCFKLNTDPTRKYDPIGYCDGTTERDACCKLGAATSGQGATDYCTGTLGGQCIADSAAGCGMGQTNVGICGAQGSTPRICCRANAAGGGGTGATTDTIGQLNYTLLEEIPGTAGVSGDFASYLQSLYKFTFWGVGIAALFMLTVGGFMYVTSAGNTSRIETAKTIITDSFLGILIALFAWLFLYILNPELVENLKMPAVVSTGTIGGGVGTGGTGGTGGGGGGTGTPAAVCQVATTGNCSPASLQGTCWAGLNLVNQASKICNLESAGGQAAIVSGTDRCVDGKGFSVGLFQINMVANGYRISQECRGENVFTQADGSSGTPAQMNNRTTVPNPLAPAYPARNCKVRDLALYNSCLAQLTDVVTNSRLACDIYRTQGWDAWPVTYRSPQKCNGSL